MPKQLSHHDQFVYYAYLWKKYAAIVQVPKDEPNHF